MGGCVGKEASPQHKKFAETKSSSNHVDNSAVSSATSQNNNVAIRKEPAEGTGSGKTGITPFSFLYMISSTSNNAVWAHICCYLNSAVNLFSFFLSDLVSYCKEFKED